MKHFCFFLSVGLLSSMARAADTAPAPNLHELMKNVVAVQTQVIWDTGNTAQDEQGNPDASRLKTADWARVADAATKVKSAAQTLATAPRILAAAPGQKIDGEGNTPGAFGAKDVQKAIDANPAAFRAFARQLTVSMGKIATAARSKDAATLFDVSGQLDQECEGCHKQFWYPNEK